MGTTAAMTTASPAGQGKSLLSLPSRWYDSLKNANRFDLWLVTAASARQGKYPDGHWFAVSIRILNHHHPKGTIMAKSAKTQIIQKFEQAAEMRYWFTSALAYGVPPSEGYTLEDAKRRANDYLVKLVTLENILYQVFGVPEHVLEAKKMAIMQGCQKDFEKRQEATA